MPFICFQSLISMKIRKYFCSNHIFLYFCNGKISLVSRQGHSLGVVPGKSRCPRNSAFGKSLIRTVTSSQILEYCSGVKVLEGLPSSSRPPS